MIKDFIGIFDNAVSDEYCDEVIEHFELLRTMNKTFSRQQMENANPINKKSEIYYMLEESDIQTLNTNSRICKVFNEAIWNCYNDYLNEYGILFDLEKHQMENIVQIQKTKPCEGYHMWHCENSKKPNSDRVLAVLLYLNDIEEGGETEFLYQRDRKSTRLNSSHT